MVTYIEQHKDLFGVEPICTTLEFPASTYYAAKSRLPSARSLRDAVLLPLLLSVWVANYRVYGARASCGRRCAVRVRTSAVTRLPV